MECIEAKALKTSLLSEIAMKATPADDDVLCFIGINNAANEDFPVEDLLNLDFTEKEQFQFQEDCFSQGDEASVKGGLIYSSSSSAFSGSDDFDSLAAAELAVRVDDLENLEWLSQFVDDTAAELSLSCPAGSFMAKSVVISENRFIPVQKTRSIPGKARSKRSRSKGWSWSPSSPPWSSVDSFSTSSFSHGSSISYPFLFREWFSIAEKPPAKKRKQKNDSEPGSLTGRKCTHCQVQKTPQWRTGPLGPKSLCNACGVRFKSGRLFAEYRPACSPTFSKELHSNSHRKVLEIRQMKDVAVMSEPESTLAVQNHW